MLLSRFFAVSVVVAMFHQGIHAQTVDGLKIIVVQGQNEKNNIKLKLATIPIVEVRDERDRLVPGARISFVLPNVGPSGKFADGSLSALVWTDSQGRAAANGLVPNFTEGKFNIRVSATFSGKSGSAVIVQENTAADGPQRPPTATQVKKKSNKWIFVVAAAGGAAVAGVVATRGSSGPSGPPPPTPTSATVGAISVGGPR